MKKTNCDSNYDVIILGAGASGLQCARTAAERNLRVLLIDHNARAGRKITVSGGGKANFTNLRMGKEFFFGSDVDFVEPCLDAFSPKMLQDFYVQHGLAYEEREHGQLFGLESAQRFVDALCLECEKLKCQFVFQYAIDEVRVENNYYIVECHHSETQEKAIYSGTSLVLALGSSAWPQVGASPLGLSLAKQFGHKIKPFTPALTTLLMPSNWALKHLSGISLPVTINIQGISLSEALLFTHTGVSGPAVLQASCYLHAENMHQGIEIDFLPHMQLEEFLDTPECGKLFLRNFVNRHMPERLADALLPEDIARRKIAELSRKARKQAHQCVHNYRLIPEKKGSMQKAEAALGGVYTQDVNAYSMESLLRDKLFIVGELLDVTGSLGGYNLHFAFASGYLAGLNV